MRPKLSPKANPWPTASHPFEAHAASPPPSATALIMRRPRPSTGIRSGRSYSTVPRRWSACYRLNVGPHLSVRCRRRSDDVRCLTARYALFPRPQARLSGSPFRFLGQRLQLTVESIEPGFPLLPAQYRHHETAELEV